MLTHQSTLNTPQRRDQNINNLRKFVWKKNSKYCKYIGLSSLTWLSAASLGSKGAGWPFRQEVLQLWDMSLVRCPLQYLRLVHFHSCSSNWKMRWGCLCLSLLWSTTISLVFFTLMQWLVSLNQSPGCSSSLLDINSSSHYFWAVCELHHVARTPDLNVFAPHSVGWWC